jgi:hypothetical protein
MAGYDPIHHELVRYGGDALSGSADDTWVLRWESLVASERCVLADADDDGDGLVGCADPDCWARCASQCPPGTSCPPTASHCGDGVCDPIEDKFICPMDCT